MEKMFKIIIVLCTVLGVLGIIVFSLFLLNPTNIRGLRITSIWSTNDGWFPTVENQGVETLYIKRFYNENGTEIRTAEVDRTNFWNGTCYVLPSGKFMTLILMETTYSSKQIFVEFTDGYKAKIYG